MLEVCIFVVNKLYYAVKIDKENKCFWYFLYILNAVPPWNLNQTRIKHANHDYCMKRSLLDFTNNKIKIADPISW